ncbi:MAG: hypothetical protein RR696_10655, partial [Clostridia bacterium]
MGITFGNWFVASDWTIRETAFDVRYQGKCESVLHLSNGWLGIRSALEENYPFQTRGMFVSGIYDAVMGEPDELPNVADALEVEITLNGLRFTMQEGKTDEYSRTLDLRTGVLCRSLLWTASDGNAYSIRFERFLSCVDLHAYAQRIQVTPLTSDADILLRTGINARMSNSGAQHMTDGPKQVFDGEYMTLVQTTAQCRYHIAHGCACRILGGSEQSRGYSLKRRVLEQTLIVKATAGQTVSMDKICVLDKAAASGPHAQTTDTLRDAALQRLRRLSSKGYDALLAEHCADMARFWAENEIVLDMDDSFFVATLRYTQLRLRFFMPVERGHSIGAKGLSGEGYKGHVFWDVESFLFPHYLYHDPDAAKRLLLYRIDRMEQAANNAKLHGYGGLMFPW